MIQRVSIYWEAHKFQLKLNLYTWILAVFKKYIWKCGIKTNLETKFFISTPVVGSEYVQYVMYGGAPSWRATSWFYW